MNPNKRNNNNCLESYRNKILPYVNTKSKDNASYSAKFLYGKFLSFVDDDDYAGASLTKKYLSTGKYKCRDMKDNKFKFYYNKANRTKAYKRLRRQFLNTMGGD